MIHRFSIFCVLACFALPAAAHADVFGFVEPADVLELAADRQVMLDFDGRRSVDIAGVRGRGEAFLYRLDAPPQTRTLPGSNGRRMGIASGDLNGDGREEIVATFDVSGTLVVLDGRFDGRLAAPTTYTLRDPAPEGRATAVAVADVDGDGDLDVLAGFGATAESAGSVSVLLNDGKTLTPQAATLPAGAPIDLAPVGDRLVVLDAAAPADANLLVFAGGPGATFEPPRTYAAGALPTSLATGDLDGDGTPEVAVGHARDVLGERAHVRILSGTTLHTTALAAGALAIADTDRDGRADLFAADADAPSRPAIPGLARGIGTLEPAMPAWAVEPGAGTERDPRLGDVDGDGKLDVTTIAADGSILLRYGSGPQLVPTGTRSDFGATVLGARPGAAIQFTNAGGGIARGVTLWTEGDASPFEFDLGTCAGAVLAHGETCHARVVFAPRAAGPTTAAVGLIADDSDLVWMHTVAGTGVAPAPTAQPAATPAPAPPAPTVVAAAKLAKPKVGRVTRKTLLRRGLRFSQRITGRARVTWTLESRGRVLASTTVSLGAATTVKLTLKLSRKGRRAFTRGHPRKLTLRARLGKQRTVTTIRLAR